MFKDIIDPTELRAEITRLKKQLARNQDENLHLKVKIRKLEVQLDKKDKQLESLLNNNQSLTFRKALNEKSASMIMNMKEKIEDLENLIKDKDAAVKSLQNQLQTARLYCQLQKKVSNYPVRTNSKEADSTSKPNKISDYNLPNTDQGTETDFSKKRLIIRPRSTSWSPGVRRQRFNTNEPRASTILGTCDESSGDNVKNLSDGEEKSTKESMQALQKSPRVGAIYLLEEIKDQSAQTSSRRSHSGRQSSSMRSPSESDLDIPDIFSPSSNEPTHEEIKKLHSHFYDMLLEVDLLKATIKKLQNDQRKTKDRLKEKDSSIEQLMRDINRLKTYKSNPEKRKALSAGPPGNKECLVSNMTLYRSNVSKYSDKLGNWNKKIHYNKKVVLSKRSTKSTTNIQIKPFASENDFDNVDSESEYI